jgi:hypothetical protein
VYQYSAITLAFGLASVVLVLRLIRELRGEAVPRGGATAVERESAS